MLLFLCCPLSASNYLSYASFHVRFGCPLLFRDRQEKNGGVKGIDGRAEEQRSLTERLVRSRLQWAGHVERMADDRLPKRAAELREQGRRRRERPTLRWEDCLSEM